jgi:PHP family Zn ribbon phosphoesterase
MKHEHCGGLLVKPTRKTSRKPGQYRCEKCGAVIKLGVSQRTIDYVQAQRNKGYGPR